MPDPNATSNDDKRLATRTLLNSAGGCPLLECIVYNVQPVCEGKNKKEVLVGGIADDIMFSGRV